MVFTRIPCLATYLELAASEANLSVLLPGKVAAFLIGPQGPYKAFEGLIRPLRALYNESPEIEGF